MSCYRRVTAWGLGFPSLLPPTSVKPLSGRPLVPLPLTLAEVQCTGTQLHGFGWMCARGARGGEQVDLRRPALLSQAAVDGSCSKANKRRLVEYEVSSSPERISKF